MPIPIPEALADNGDAAVTKANASRSGRYLWQSILAGAYVGIAVVLLLSVAGPLAATENPATKLVQGAVFGVALTLVVFAGAELFTGNAMVMLQGWWSRRIRGADLARVWGVSLVGNLIGSLLLAGAVHGAGTLAGSPAADLLHTIVDGKAALSGPALFWRSVLCNALVCLGLWMAARTRSDGAKLAVLWWALLAFVASGFEHSVANMTTFGLGILDGSATWAELARNLAYTVPGNIVGGGLVIGIGYAWSTGVRPTTAATLTAPAEIVLSDSDDVTVAPVD